MLIPFPLVLCKRVRSPPLSSPHTSFTHTPVSPHPSAHPYYLLPPLPPSHTYTHIHTHTPHTHYAYTFPPPPSYMSSFHSPDNGTVHRQGGGGG